MNRSLTARKMQATSSLDSATRMGGTIRPSTINTSARTVEVVFTTGQSGKRWHWDIGYYLEELEVTERAVRRERLDKGLSVIGDHDTWRGIENVFGITEQYRFENGELIGTVRFATDEESEKIWQKIQDGILRHFSLGYIVHRYDATLNNGDGMDTYRATDWEPTELSIVVVSFETNNGIRSADGNRPADENLHPLEINFNGDKDTMNRKLRNLIYRDPAGVHGDPAGGGQPAPAPAATPDPVHEARNLPANPAPANPAPAAEPVQENRTLLATFRNMARDLGFDDQSAVDAYLAGMGEADFSRKLLLDAAKRSMQQTPQVPLVGDGRNDAQEATRNIIADSIMARQGVIEFTAETRKYAGATLMDLARHLVSGGNSSSVMGLSAVALAGRAFQSTSDFPLILENVMNKMLARGYEETPRTFIGLGNRASATDFRAKHTYRIGDAPSLVKLGENGEYKSGTIGEAKESYAIDTFARKIGFSRKMMINDDLNALVQVPRMFGQAGSRLESDVVWGLLLNYDFAKNTAANFKMRDGKHLYHADHSNLLTGAGSALSKTSLSDIRKLGRKFKTLDGNFMNIMWNTLVVPEDLETVAEELLINTILATQTSSTNSFQGRYDFRIEPRLAVVSPTAWYAFTNMLYAFEYAYLDGNEGLYTEVNQSTDVDGVEILVRKDFGAGFADERGSAKANGA